MSNYEQHYQKSVEILTQYIKETKTMPTEKAWNKIATENNILTSRTLGYIYGGRFADLCRSIFEKVKEN